MNNLLIPTYDGACALGQNGSRSSNSQSNDGGLTSCRGCFIQDGQAIGKAFRDARVTVMAWTRIPGPDTKLDEPVHHASDTSQPDRTLHRVK